MLSDEQWILNGSAFSYTKIIRAKGSKKVRVGTAPTRKCYRNLRVPKAQCHQPLRNTLPETNSSPLKIDGWFRIIHFLLGQKANFQRRTVSFRECKALFRDD